MAENEANESALAPEVVSALWREAETLREPMVAFARRLIQTPSLPGEEAGVASLVAAEMQRLGYDEVRVDEAGNVIGYIRASYPESAERPCRSVMFNTHMDHVDVGDQIRWPHPPYEAVVLEGEIWGRGASDLKGPLACQVYAGALLLRMRNAELGMRNDDLGGIPQFNDVYVAGVVQEEVGGLGSSVLTDHLRTDYAVVGEPSQNRLALGHRGRLEVHVTITGKSVHASVPQAGANPLYSMARFLLSVEQMKFEPDPDHPALGPTTVAPTLFSTDQTSANVVPGECVVVLDVRNTPADTPEVVLQRVRELLDAALEGGDERSGGSVAEIKPVTLTSYTGVTRSFSNAAAPFGISPASQLVSSARSTLNSALKREVPTQMWRFATDAGHLVAKGIEVIGFGPGYEDVIHTVDERISIDMMVEGMVANAALALGLR